MIGDKFDVYNQILKTSINCTPRYSNGQEGKTHIFSSFEWTPASLEQQPLHPRHPSTIWHPYSDCRRRGAGTRPESVRVNCWIFTAITSMWTLLFEVLNSASAVSCSLASGCPCSVTLLRGVGVAEVVLEGIFLFSLVPAGPSSLLIILTLHLHYPHAHESLRVGTNWTTHLRCCNKLRIVRFALTRRSIVHIYGHTQRGWSMSLVR